MDNKMLSHVDNTMPNIKRVSRMQQKISWCLSLLSLEILPGPKTRKLDGSLDANPRQLTTSASQRPRRRRLLA